jgi:hypothetical protein
MKTALAYLKSRASILSLRAVTEIKADHLDATLSELKAIQRELRVALQTARNHALVEMVSVWNLKRVESSTGALPSKAGADVSAVFDSIFADSGVLHPDFSLGLVGARQSPVPDQLYSLHIIHVSILRSFPDSDGNRAKLARVMLQAYCEAASGATQVMFPALLSFAFAIPHSGAVRIKTPPPSFFFLPPPPTLVVPLEGARYALFSVIYKYGPSGYHYSAGVVQAFEDVSPPPVPAAPSAAEPPAAAEAGAGAPERVISGVFSAINGEKVRSVGLDAGDPLLPLSPLKHGDAAGENRTELCVVLYIPLDCIDHDIPVSEYASPVLFFSSLFFHPCVLTPFFIVLFCVNTCLAGFQTSCSQCLPPCSIFPLSESSFAIRFYCVNCFPL